MQLSISRLSLVLLTAFNLGLVAPLLVHGQAVSNTEAEMALNRARAAFRRNELNVTKQELKLVARLQANLPESRLLSALIAEQEKKNDEAIKHLKSALQLQPNYALANFVLARLYFAELKRDDALTTVRLAINQGATFADAYCLLGDLEISLNRIEPALEAYLQALNQPPPNKSINAEFRLRVAALQNLIEFQAHRDAPGYEWPKQDRADEIQESNKLARTFGTGNQQKMIEFGGVLTTQGLEQVRVLGSSGKLPGPIYHKGYSIKDDRKYVLCTPAKKNGIAVPFWFRWKDFP